MEHRCAGFGRNWGERSVTRHRGKTLLGGLVVSGLVLGMFGVAAEAAPAAKKPPAPTITAFKPTSGKVGQKVTITGTNLSGASKLTFHNKTATIISDTATKITTKVPTGAKTGTISVTTAAGTATSTSAFKVTK